MFDSTCKFFEGLFVGLTLGFVGGILLAPKSGSDLRKDIAHNSEDIYKRASDSLSDIQHKSNDAIHDFQKRSEELLRKAQDGLKETRDKLSGQLGDIGTDPLGDDFSSIPSA